MADERFTVTFTGPVQAGAIGFGDGQTVTGELHTADDQAEPEPDDSDGPTVVADSVEFGAPGGPIFRGRRGD